MISFVDIDIYRLYIDMLIDVVLCCVMSCGVVYVASCHYHAILGHASVSYTLPTAQNSSVS